MDVLWAPWRMTYVGGAHEPRACIFCAAPTGDPRDRLLLGATVHSLVMLNRFPYQSGHLMVAPRRHTADLPGLSATEHGDLAETLRRALAAIDDTLRPEGFNLGMNLGTCAGAGFADHLHWHVVPYLRLRRGTSGSGRAEGCGAGWRGQGLIAWCQHKVEVSAPAPSRNVRFTRATGLGPAGLSRHGDGPSHAG